MIRGPHGRAAPASTATPATALSCAGHAVVTRRGGAVLACVATNVPCGHDADVRIRQDRSRSARRRQVGRALARVVPGQRSAGGPRRGPGRARAASPSPTPGARRSGSRPCSSSTARAPGLRKSLTAAVHRARDAQLEDRASALVGAVRPHAGVPGRLLRVRARGLASRAEPEVAAAAARSSCAGRSCTWASTPRSASTATSSGSRRSGRSCTGSSRSRCSRQFERAADRAAAARRHRRRSSTSTSPALLLQLMNAGNMTARHLEWVAGELDEWCAHAAPVARAVVGDVVLRRPRRARGTAPPHARAARGPRAVPRHASAALGADAERRDAGAEDPRRSRCRTGRRSAASSWGSSPSSRRRSTRNSSRSRAAASGWRPPAPSMRSSASPRSRAILREEEHDPDPARWRPGKSFGGTMELAVFGRMRNEPDRKLELARRRFAAFAAPGGPWEVKDVSQTGFRLLAPMSVANMVTLGTLAAIRPHRPDAVDARHRAPHEAHDRRSRGDRPAGHRQHADRRRPRRAAQEPSTPTTRSTARRRPINGRTFQGSSSRCASATPNRRCSR